LQGESVHYRYRGEKSGGEELDDRVAPGDPVTAVAAAAPQHDEREYRDVIVPADLLTAGGAGRAWPKDRFGRGETVYDHIEEAADCQTAEEDEDFRNWEV
jgi:hypothetical protein